MTPEQRLDRLERIAKLLVRAGMRARREMNEKINILLDAQIRNDERFAKTDEKFARLAETTAQADEKFAQIMGRLAEKSAETDEKFARLVESQTHSDRKLDALLDVIRKEREERGGDSGQS